jgi:hypothetical protein
LLFPINRILSSCLDYYSIGQQKTIISNNKPYHPKDGIAINLNDNKVAGVKLGRPKGVGKSKLDEFKEEIVALLRNGSSKNLWLTGIIPVR